MKRNYIQLLSVSNVVALPSMSAEDSSPIAKLGDELNFLSLDLRCTSKTISALVLVVSILVRVQNDTVLVPPPDGRDFYLLELPLLIGPTCCPKATKNMNTHTHAAQLAFPFAKA